MVQGGALEDSLSDLALRPIPSPEVMDKAARARSLLYVAPEEAKQRRRQEVRPEKGERDGVGSVSSTLGVSKRPWSPEPSPTARHGEFTGASDAQVGRGSRQEGFLTT